MKVGRRRELEIAEELRRKGFLEVYWQPPRAKWRPSKSDEDQTFDDAGQDIFGLFDVVGVVPGGAIALVQVCRRRGMDDRKTAIETWCRAHHPAAHIFLAYYDSDSTQIKKVFVHTLGWNDMRWYEATRWNCE